MLVYCNVYSRVLSWCGGGVGLVGVETKSSVQGKSIAYELARARDERKERPHVTRGLHVKMRK